MMPAPGNEPVLLSVGDISVTPSHVIVPQGRYPLHGTTWTVQDSTQVSIVDRTSDPRQQACRRSRVIAESRDVPLQVAAGDELEHEVRAAAMLTDLVEWHDVGVVERGDHLSLEAQTAERLISRPQHVGPKRLEGDDAIEPLVPGLEDASHPAAGDLVKHLELANLALARLFGL